MKVRFLTPYNTYEEMEYHDVLEYCKYIATLPMFKDDFEEFKKHYSYFSAYFDYVMFRLGYIMMNPLLIEGIGAIAHKDQLTFFYDKRDDYDTIKRRLEDKNDHSYSFMPRITKCDDLTMQVAKQTTEIRDDVLVDPNMMSMMSKTPTGLSHVITGNTVLNQLLIASKEVLEDYQKFFHRNYSSGVEYLVNSMGFIRLVSPKYVPLMIINKRVATSEQKEFFHAGKEKYDYSFCDMNQDVESKVDLYQKVLRQTKKEL